MKFITLSKYDYIFKGKNRDYRLSIYTDGYTISSGCFVQLKKQGYIWETSMNDLFIDIDRKIRRTKNNINNIIDEVALKLKEKI